MRMNADTLNLAEPPRNGVSPAPSLHSLGRRRIGQVNRAGPESVPAKALVASAASHTAGGRGADGSVGFLDLNGHLCVLPVGTGNQWWHEGELDALVGKPVSELSGADAGWWPEAVAWSKGMGGRVLTIRTRPHGGSVRRGWLELVFCGLRPDGAPTGHRVLVRELSGAAAEAEELRTELARERQRGRARLRLMTMVSHELRNPLTATVCAAEVLRLKLAATGAPDEEVLEYLDTIFGASGRMSRLMDELLLLARLESGQLSFRPAPVSPLGLCRKLRDEVGIAEAADRIVITSAVPDGVCYDLDAALLRHILVNLLSNALKYSPAGRPVSIRIAADAGRLRIAVEDRGIGIPAGDQSRLFEEFFRASNVGNVRGTGVGLSIARECARLHGGRLGFESVPGRGTTFTVELPVRQGAAEPE